MSEFRTVVNIPESKNKISHNSGTIFIGSCFSENIGGKLFDNKFTSIINPLGVLYNPVSISKGIHQIIEKRIFDNDDLLFYNDQWHSLSHHSSFSNQDIDKCLARINENIISSHEFLKSAEYIFISYGTARVFYLNETGEVVSNCHKIPSVNFTRKLAEPDELTKVSSDMIEELRNFNPNLKIIFTISPIRHLKDTPFGNQINKSSLFLALNNIIDKSPFIDYFPSYEIMMDELRDYRFYGEDMIHLNKTSLDYIFTRFSDTFFTSSTIELIKQIGKISDAYNHRPFNSKSDSHKKFAMSSLNLISTILKKEPGLNFTKEKEYFEKILK